MYRCCTKLDALLPSRFGIVVSDCDLAESPISTDDGTSHVERIGDQHMSVVEVARLELGESADPEALATANTTVTDEYTANQPCYLVSSSAS